jgi:uncharacterized protein YqgV (UPF0045/DUF77 family)
MKAIAEIQVVPIGAGVSVRREVKRAHELLGQAGLKTELHAYGTNGAAFDAIVQPFAQSRATLHRAAPTATATPATCCSAT